ncbi:MAG: hypothetical protein U1E36_02515 [Rickettsiales bacterium]
MKDDANITLMDNVSLKRMELKDYVNEIHLSNGQMIHANSPPLRIAAFSKHAAGLASLLDV